MKQLIVVIFLFISFSSRAQAAEIGVLGGLGYYLGDLNPHTHFYNTKFAGSVFYRDQIRRSDRLSLKFQLSFGNVQAFDADAQSESQVNRNLSFQSRIIELGPIIEINFLPYEIGSGRKPGTPYLFAGITYFKMNPMGRYNDDWIELQSLRTEGQGSIYNSNKPYKLSQISIPFGVGMKININSRMAIGLEYGLRKTFTDYLDDVSSNYVHPTILKENNGTLSAELSDQSLNNEGSFSFNNGVQRGNPNNKDWYAFGGITFSFRLKAHSTCP
jgi:opacity protein-like surface antigen